MHSSSSNTRLCCAARLLTASQKNGLAVSDCHVRISWHVATKLHDRSHSERQRRWNQALLGHGCRFGAGDGDPSARARPAAAIYDHRHKCRPQDGSGGLDSRSAVAQCYPAGCPRRQTNRAAMPALDGDWSSIFNPPRACLCVLALSPGPE